MNSDQLAVERATWAVTIKSWFREPYVCKKYLNDFSTIFVVTHADSPGWLVNVSIITARRNRIVLHDRAAATKKLLSNELIGYTVSSYTEKKLMQALWALRLRYDHKEGQAVQKELEAARWLRRQTEELSGTSNIPGIAVAIIPDGVHAGCYRVTVAPGNPLEHLTLEQYKAFNSYLNSLCQK